jgi:hypothetical protein
MPVASPRIAQHRYRKRGGGVTTVRGASTSDHRQNARRVPVATLRIILHAKRMEPTFARAEATPAGTSALTIST